MDEAPADVGALVAESNWRRRRPSGARSSPRDPCRRRSRWGRRRAVVRDAPASVRPRPVHGADLRVVCDGAVRADRDAGAVGGGEGVPLGPWPTPTERFLGREVAVRPLDAAGGAHLVVLPTVGAGDLDGADRPARRSRRPASRPSGRPPRSRSSCPAAWCTSPAGVPVEPTFPRGPTTVWFVRVWTPPGLYGRADTLGRAALAAGRAPRLGAARAGRGRVRRRPSRRRTATAGRARTKPNNAYFSSLYSFSWLGARPWSLHPRYLDRRDVGKVVASAGAVAGLPGEGVLVERRQQVHGRRLVAVGFDAGRVQAPQLAVPGPDRFAEGRRRPRTARSAAGRSAGPCRSAACRRRRSPLSLYLTVKRPRMKFLPSSHS